MIPHKSMKNTIQTKLNINPKSLNRNSQMRVMTYSGVNGGEVKKAFQNLQIKRSFSKMPFSKMPCYTMILYVLTYCVMYAILYS
jgi:hypothetical protein